MACPGCGCAPFALVSHRAGATDAGCARLRQRGRAAGAVGAAIPTRQCCWRRCRRSRTRGGAASGPIPNAPRTLDLDLIDMDGLVAARRPTRSCRIRGRICARFVLQPLLRRGAGLGASRAGPDGGGAAGRRCRTTTRRCRIAAVKVAARACCAAACAACSSPAVVAIWKVLLQSRCRRPPPASPITNVRGRHGARHRRRLHCPDPEPLRARAASPRSAPATSAAARN